MQNREFHLRLGQSIEIMSAEEIYKLVLICGPKTDLQISLSEEILDKMFKKSPSYERALKMVEYNSVTETVSSKLFATCVEDHQPDIVDYMLRSNFTLVNVPIWSKTTDQKVDIYQFMDEELTDKD